MADPIAREPDPARLESLRRRLYQPGASEEDRRRFASLTPPPPPSSATPPDDPPAAPPAAPPPRRRLLALLTAGVAGTAAVLLLVAPGPAAQPVARVTPSTDPAIAGSEVKADLVAPRPDSPTATPVPTRLAGVRTALQRFRGSGGTVVAIDTGAAQQVNGTLLVMLTATSAKSVRWIATRPTRQPGHSQYVEVVAAGGADDPTAPAGYGMHVYDGSPPSRLVVDDPGTDDWTLTVAFLPRGQSEQ